MYIKAAKRMGDSYAAAVVESGERTRCFFPGAVVCDVDDVFVRFVMGSVPEESSRQMNEVVGDCFAVSPSWCSENGIDPPSDFCSPMSVVSDGVAFLKARVPRDGHAFKVGDRSDVTLCVRDVKLSGGRLVVNWRVESYTQASVDEGQTVDSEGVSEEASEGIPKGSHDQEDATVETGDAPESQEVECEEPESQEVECEDEPESQEVEREEAMGESGDTIVEFHDQEGATVEAGIEVHDQEEDVFESGLRSVRETLALLQSQMDAVERAGRRAEARRVCA